jgi:hypothetical protein
MKFQGYQNEENAFFAMLLIPWRFGLSFTLFFFWQMHINKERLKSFGHDFLFSANFTAGIGAENCRNSLSLSLSSLSLSLSLSLSFSLSLSLSLSLSPPPCWHLSLSYIFIGLLMK